MNRIQFLLFFLLSQTALAKDVTIEWNAVKGARIYDLEISQNEKEIVTKKLNDTVWIGNLKPGLYFYRIRTIDKLARAGSWSEKVAIVIKADDLQTAQPPDEKKFITYFKLKNLSFSWPEIEGIDHYQFTLEKEGKKIEDKSLRKNNLNFSDLEVGRYRWTVTPYFVGGKKKYAANGGIKHDFNIEKEQIQSPTPITPTGLIPPNDKVKLDFEWTPVKNAEFYIIEIYQKNSKRKKTLNVTENHLELPLYREGLYAWTVRAAVKSNDPQKPIASIRSTANFKIDKLALLKEGKAYLAASWLWTLYDYKVSSPLHNVPLGEASSDSSTARLSGEYWLKKSWGGSAAFEINFFKVNGTVFERKTAELFVKHRLPLTNNSYGWRLAAKGGPEYREYVQVLPSFSKSVGTLGFSLGLDIRKVLSKKWSLGFKTHYFLPLLSLSPNIADKIAGNSAFRNISFGAQALYWFADRWGAGLGAYHEKRSLSFDPPNTTTGREEVITDATFFFGSIIYSFGEK